MRTQCAPDAQYIKAIKSKKPALKTSGIEGLWKGTVPNSLENQIVSCITARGPVTTEERLYSSKCGSCHRLLPPEEYTAEQWRHYVDKYGKKLTQDQKQDLLDYHEQRAADAHNSKQAIPQ